MFSAIKSFFCQIFFKEETSVYEQTSSEITALLLGTILDVVGTVNGCRSTLRVTDKRKNFEELFEKVDASQATVEFKVLTDNQDECLINFCVVVPVDTFSPYMSEDIKVNMKYKIDRNKYEFDLPVLIAKLELDLKHNRNFKKVTFIEDKIKDTSGFDIFKVKMV